jgi:hypothetical protein
MNSRFSFDTHLLKIREVTALNSVTAEFIQPMEVPVIGINGSLKWMSSLEFLSSISIPAVSSSVLDILQSVQPGISTMSTIQTSTMNQALQSSMAGIGNLGYISSVQFVYNEIDQLSGTYHYISATTLYDCFSFLGQLNTIGNECGPMTRIGSNFSGGYVSTVHPGEYKIYKSTFGLSGSNLFNRALTNGTAVGSAIVNIGGYSTHIVSTSKMMVDIQANMNLSFPSGLTSTCFLSTFLRNPLTNAIVGQPITQTFVSTNSNVWMGSLKFLLETSNLQPFSSNLEVRHLLFNGAGDVNRLTTNIPTTQGIFVTLDNTD